MKLLMMQPVLIPNLHDLARFLWLDGANHAKGTSANDRSGTLLITDLQPWSRKSRTHRAVIRTPEGTAYINVPVVKEDRNKPIRDVRIDQKRNWINPLLRSLEYNYRNSIFYDFYEPEIRADLQKGLETEYLADYSALLWNRIFTYLEQSFGFGLMRESERARSTIQASPGRSITTHPDELAEMMGASCYVQEWESRHYMRQGDRALTLLVDVPVYRQHFEGFEPDCCLLDLLFQMGPESFRVVEGLAAGTRVASDAQEENRARMEFHQPETHRNCTERF